MDSTGSLLNPRYFTVRECSWGISNKQEKSNFAFPILCILISSLKHECVCFSQDEVQRLRARVEEVIQENERLHDDVAKMAGFSHKDW